jgi:ABC-type sugar transport system permease subunit
LTPLPGTRAPVQDGRLGRLNLTALVMIAPAVVLAVVFITYPMLESLRLSFFEFAGIGPQTYVGLDNYAAIVADPRVIGAVINNVIFAVALTLLTVSIGTILAAVIERRVRGWRFFKVIWFVPLVIPMTVTGIVWANAYDPHVGVINSLGGLVGIESNAYLADPSTALAALIFVAVWQTVAYPMIIILAAMEGVDPNIHDAATVDGVSASQRLFRVTLPNIRGVLLTVLLLQMIFSFKVFDVVWTMTQGGPGNVTDVLGTLVYKEAFSFHRFGTASAIAFMSSAIITIVAVLFLLRWRPARSNTA